MRTLSSSVCLSLLLGCAHSVQPVAPTTETVSRSPVATAESEVYAQLAHERRQQSIVFLEDLLGMRPSDTTGCD